MVRISAGSSMGFALLLLHSTSLNLQITTMRQPIGCKEAITHSMDGSSGDRELWCRTSRAHIPQPHIAARLSEPDYWQNSHNRV
ncbi:hypothetical protein BDV37DRAFT_263736 [Aspergillus pseudonomiae]|uniref:Secreted protein n=1 Tax=Aspergillus pseudonomiae TaxID=1506151 RepID=A0A5N7CVU1_9EURO|nr:uncharacterized protein BDV37DRAFT_263736 [Aspergillus pseudonomiae]KAE8398261.1 hypothetical protein BDV37DRAFT_263736 [Aspergillus pseudonomiae]